MQEIIHSVGIDIGTSTTQLIFSKLTVENRASSYTVPRIDIVDKEVVYLSDIYFTPLKSSTEIDAAKVKDIVKREYNLAGKTPKDMNTGAVIITGEAARKDNANEILEALSSMAGDFVVATAGPDLESVLSARGAGADTLSEEHRTVIANLDVGGGTTNIAVYETGRLKSVACLDIGGRLIKVENGLVSYIFPKIANLAKANGIPIAVGDRADEKILYKIAQLLADQLAQAVYLKSSDDNHQKLYTNNGNPLKKIPEIKGLTFSGGVADCYYNPKNGNVFEYGDIGVLFGKALLENEYFKKIKIYKAKETIRATVVGAGIHTTEVSGSTITYDLNKLPIKNIPILKISSEDEGDIKSLVQSLHTQLPMYVSDGTIDQVAISFSGEYYTSFLEIQTLADAIIDGAKKVIAGAHPLILVIEKDIGKALGHALKVKLNHSKDILCIDGIVTINGDYIDIGLPIAAGRVVPVVIKTLIFNS